MAITMPLPSNANMPIETYIHLGSGSAMKDLAYRGQTNGGGGQHDHNDRDLIGEHG